MNGQERSFGSESPTAQQDSPGGVKHVLWKVKDKAKKLKNKIKRKHPAHGYEGVEKAQPGSDDEDESDESPISAEHQEPKRDLVDGNAGYDTRDLSGDKSEFAQEAYSPETAVQDGLGHLSKGAKCDTESVPSDGQFPKENLAAEKRNEGDRATSAQELSSPLAAPSSIATRAKDFRNEQPREPTDPMHPVKVSVIDSAPESLVAPSQHPPSSTDISDVAGKDTFIQDEKSDPSENSGTVHGIGDGSDLGTVTGEVLPVSAERKHDVSVTPNSTVTQTWGERDRPATVDSKTHGDRDEPADQEDAIGDQLPVSEFVSTEQHTEQDEDAKAEDYKELSGKSDIATVLNKTPDEDGIPVSYPSTVDKQENVDGERGSCKDRAGEGLANAEDSVAVADMNHKAFCQGDANSSDVGNEMENESEGKSFLQVARERIVGVTNYFPSGNVEDNSPADEQDIGLPTDEQLIPASDKQSEPTIASRAGETAQGLQDSLASNLGHDASRPTAAAGTEDGECAQEKHIEGPDHEQQLTSSDNVPLSPNKPTIASRAAGTVLGFKDSLASKFGYGITSPTSPASPISASEEDVTGNLRDTESPKSKSYVQQLQEVAAGGKDSLLNKLGYGEQTTVSENVGGDEQAPGTVDQQKSSLPKEEEISYDGKDIMAEKVGSFPDLRSTTGDPVTNDEHQKASIGDIGHGSSNSVTTVDHQKASIFDPGEDDVALSRIITDTVSGTAASFKDTILRPFSPRAASSPTASDSN